MVIDPGRKGVLVEEVLRIELILCKGREGFIVVEVPPLTRGTLACRTCDPVPLQNGSYGMFRGCCLVS